MKHQTVENFLRFLPKTLQRLLVLAAIVTVVAISFAITLGSVAHAQGPTDNESRGGGDSCYQKGYSKGYDLGHIVGRLDSGSTYSPEVSMEQWNVNLSLAKMHGVITGDCSSSRYEKGFRAGYPAGYNRGYYELTPR
ncbi:hypothetical protein KSC_103010 [Ktedonobacter sp. SOSP1-52]|uniref:hypothetical protein n=1 Tax=Ktedonobacter sp. SOSP1-52 TaxID=2778366 RepID=UPI001915FCDB|nr:hypothetical protein [Ktedonobacter sp. SOSP1-52]GHO71409.1 hypothetical protein KSC_103010 [Ktedonobacter sp. SOSP1-52]